MIVTLLLSIVVFIPSDRERFPNPAWVLKQAKESSETIKRRVIGGMIRAYDLNEKVLRIKGTLLAYALIIGSLTMSSAIIAKGCQAMLYYSHNNESSKRPSHERGH